MDRWTDGVGGEDEWGRGKGGPLLNSELFEQSAGSFSDGLN